MKVYILTTDNYNECENDCYSESILCVFSTKEKAEDCVKNNSIREGHYTIHEETVF